jgi:hypothetical protein
MEGRGRGREKRGERKNKKCLKGATMNFKYESSL